MQNEQTGTPPAAAYETDIDAARKLLEELFAELPGDETPPQPEQ